jgi:hypothetical protein
MYPDAQVEWLTKWTESWEQLVPVVLKSAIGSDFTVMLWVIEFLQPLVSVTERVTWTTPGVG